MNFECRTYRCILLCILIRRFTSVQFNLISFILFHKYIIENFIFYYLLQFLAVSLIIEKSLGSSYLSAWSNLAIIEERNEAFLKKVHFKSIMNHGIWICHIFIHVRIVYWRDSYCSQFISWCLKCTFINRLNVDFKLILLVIWYAVKWYIYYACSYKFTAFWISYILFNAQTPPSMN